MKGKLKIFERGCDIEHPYDWDIILPEDLELLSGKVYKHKKSAKRAAIKTAERLNITITNLDKV